MDSVFQTLAAHPALHLGAAAVLGLLVGSFLNVVILRLPRMMEQEWRTQCAELSGHGDSASLAAQERITLSRPASTCPHCGHRIRPWENIPILSYALLRGRCAACRHPISPRYPIIEGVTGLLSVVVAATLGPGWATVAALVLTWALIALTMIDYDTQLLPDSITLPLLWLGLIVNSFALFTPLIDAVWGAVAGYLALWLVYHLFKLATGKEGMGFGDFKLLAALGAWLGWTQLPLVILLSSLVGAVVGILLITLRGRDRQLPIPFGPYLAAAGWIALLWGQDMIHAYLGLFRAPPTGF